MAKTLELHFNTELGKTVSLSVENPKEPIDEAVVKQSMAQIIASEIFTTITHPAFYKPDHGKITTLRVSN
jgi:SET domain-containing protein